MVVDAVEDRPNKRIRLDTTQLREASGTQLAAPKLQAGSHSSVDRRPAKPTNDSRRNHRPDRSGNDRQHARTDRHSSTRPDSDSQRSRSHDRADVHTEGGWHHAHPADRQRDRQSFHPNRYRGYDYTGRDGRWPDGPDNRGWYNPPDGRWYHPPRRGYLPSDSRRELSGHQYLHPDDYSYSRGESGTADEYGDEAFGGEEYADEEYADEEYADEEYAGNDDHDSSYQ